jgi:TPR repeat protein
MPSEITSVAQQSRTNVSEGAVSPNRAETIATGRADTVTLLDLGRSFLSEGDVATARVLLAKAATLGDAQAALELGKSYDPIFLAKSGAVGVTPNVARAIEWYKKAKTAGLVEAAQHLDRLAQLPNLAQTTSR